MQTGRRIPTKQRIQLEDNLIKNKYKKLETEEALAESRSKFDNRKKTLRRRWERETGQSWPTYTEDIINLDTGKVIRKKGQAYDAHELIPNAYGAPKKWWNMHPAKFPDEHQAGIHRTGGEWRKLFPDL